MECSDKTDFFYNSSSSSHSQSSQESKFVQYPCAACKILRRRCSEKCVLAPYFPPSEPQKFTIVHKVFGARNVIRKLQEIPKQQRTDAVNSMVYEATARIRDPVYGCAGAVSLLQQQIMDLQEELAKAEAEMFKMQCQNANLVSIVCPEMCSSQSQDFMNVTEQQLWDNTGDFSLTPFWTLH
ncbi:hypothetical protein ACH5RR_018771 [Cinchona calisaya]|uniref:LOB domain-containing protein n=1 Tax=Cinchona calisaya TaxID=153742 RepID=A0ABD2ZR34_9GENT